MSINAIQHLEGQVAAQHLEGQVTIGTYEKNVGLPAGGKTGQILCKKSDKDYDVEWSDFKIPEQYGLVTYNQDKTITIT